MEHYLYGVVVFTICLIVLFITCGRWREEPPARAEVIAWRPSPEGLSATANWPTVLCATVSLLIVAIGPLFARVLDVPHAVEPASAQVPPDIAPPWTAVPGYPLSWSPHFVAPHGEVLQAYAAADTVVQLYIARYDAGQPGVKVVSRGNRLYDDRWWAIGDERRAVVVDGQSFQLNERVVGSSRSALRIWNWYRINEIFTGNDYTAKLLLARARLFRSPVEAVAFVAATEERPGTDAVTILRTFLSQLSLTYSAQLTAQHRAFR